MTTCVSKATTALVVVDQLYTVEAARCMAGLRQALVEIPFTVFPSESWKAGARVTAHTIHTLSSIQTPRFLGAWLGGTVIHIHFTMDPICSMWTDAHKMINEIDTCSSIETWLRMAFIDIIFTVHPLVSWFTYTLVCALIVLACSSIATRVGLALINHYITVVACVSCLALTLVKIVHIQTLPSVLTHILHIQTMLVSIVLAGHFRDVTINSFPS